MSRFKYSIESINAMIEQNLVKGMGKATMYGVYNDLKMLKPIIEKIYDENIFYLSYFASDAPFMGWTCEQIHSMLKITNGITEKFEEIYALILCGLGEKLDDQGQEVDA